MANERWERLAEQQGIAYAKTVAEAMNLKLDADNPADFSCQWQNPKEQEQIEAPAVNSEHVFTEITDASN